MRPCDCDKPTCRLCSLARTDPRYRKLWGVTDQDDKPTTAPTGPHPTISFVINLERRTDRFAKVLLEMAKTSFLWRVFPATDGKTLPTPEGWEKGTGAFGLWVTAQRLLETAIAEGHTTADHSVGFFEDDVTFCKDFQTKYERFMSLVPADSDCVMLGGQHLKPAVPVKPGVVRVVECHRTHAMILRGTFLKPLYQHWSSNFGHIDQLFTLIQPNYKVYAPEQFLAGQAEGMSDINGREQAVRYWQPRKKRCVGCWKKNPK